MSENKILEIKGEDLLGLEYEPIFPYFAKYSQLGCFKILHGDFVNIEDGTGIVHLAPGFGEDDHELCKKHNIPVVCPVDEGGNFTAEIFDITPDNGYKISPQNFDRVKMPEIDSKYEVIIETQRCYVRKFTNSADDFENLVRLHTNPEVYQYFRLNYTRKDCMDYMENILESYQPSCHDKFCQDESHKTHGEWAVFLKDGDKFVGRAGLFKNGDKNSEITYGFLPEFWSNGIASEIVTEITKWGFVNLGVKQIFATVLESNFGSIHILEQVVGMKKISSKYHNLRKVEMLSYSCSNEDFFSINPLFEDEKSFVRPFLWQDLEDIAKILSMSRKEAKEYLMKNSGFVAINKANGKITSYLTNCEECVNDKNQIRELVYSLLRSVPKGKITTYGDIAKKLNIKSSRYIGYLMKTNPDLISTPCYKVVAKNGYIGGYVKGYEEKKRLLENDGVKIDGKGFITNPDEVLYVFPQNENLSLKNRQVFECNDDIIKYLKKQGSWVRTDQYLHNYPHCWRSDTPLIYKALSSWYVKVTDIKDKMVQINKGFHFSTERLYGRITTENDADLLTREIFGDPEVREHYDFDKDKICDINGTLRKIEYYNQQLKHGLPRFTVFERSSGEFVASIGLSFFDPAQENFENGIVEVSYLLAKSKMGKGYGGEILNGLIEWAFTSLPIEKLYGVILDGNIKSSKILEKNGFALTKTGKNLYIKTTAKGDFVGHMYELKKSDTIYKNIKPTLGINWIPDHIQDGQFGKWLENARDWSISRNRFWGCPVPVWRSNNSAYPRIDVYGSLDEIQTDFGVRVENLHRPFIDNLTRKNPDDPTGKSMMRRVPDVLDCWFESGSMPYAQIHYPFSDSNYVNPLKTPPKNLPADFITEYIAQTRGWFYTMMVLSTALFEKPPFKNCICHGTILDSNSQKLSKRLKNYADPVEMFETYGSDAMRYYLVSKPVMRGMEINIDKDGAGIRDTYRVSIMPIINAFNFFCLYANADEIRAEEVDIENKQYFHRDGVVFETRRLYVRPFTQDDFDNLLLVHGDDEVMQLTSSGVRNSTRVQSDLDYYIQHQKEYGFSAWAICDKETNDFIGRAGIVKIKKYDNEFFADKFEVGYMLRKEFWNLGYGIEIASAITKFAFEKLNKELVCFRMSKENTPSMNLAKKLGAKFYCDTKFDINDSVAYILEKENFTPMDKIPNQMDKYILSKLKFTIEAIDGALDKFDTISACEEIEKFFEVLNNWYIRRNRDRFWSKEKNYDKYSAYDTLYTVLLQMSKAISPILPFTSERIYLGLTNIQLK